MSTAVEPWISVRMFTEIWRSRVIGFATLVVGDELTWSLLHLPSVAGNGPEKAVRGTHSPHNAQKSADVKTPLPPLQNASRTGAEEEERDQKVREYCSRDTARRYLTNAASKSRIIRPSVPSRRGNRTKSKTKTKTKSALEEIGLESWRVLHSRDVQTLAASCPVKSPWAFAPFVPVGHASTCAVSGIPIFT